MPKNGKQATVLEFLSLQGNFLCLIYSPQCFLSKKKPHIKLREIKLQEPWNLQIWNKNL